MTEYYQIDISDYLSHHGVKGMKWGQRRALNKASNKLVRAEEMRMRARDYGTESRKGQRLMNKSNKLTNSRVVKKTNAMNISKENRDIAMTNAAKKFSQKEQAKTTRTENLHREFKVGAGVSGLLTAGAIAASAAAAPIAVPVAALGAGVTTINVIGAKASSVKLNSQIDKAENAATISTKYNLRRNEE